MQTLPNNENNLIIHDEKNFTCNLKNNTKLFVWKNFFLICISIFFLMIAVNTVFGLQGSLNRNETLNFVSSIIFFSIYSIFALLLPQLLMNFIKFKWTLTFAFVMQLLFIGLNAYPSWFTTIPGTFNSNNDFYLGFWFLNTFFFLAGIVSGIGQSIALTSAITGVRKLCNLYSEANQTDPHGLYGFFFGLFGAVLHLGKTLTYKKTNRN